MAAKKSTAKKSTAKKSTAKKSTAKKSPAKKTASRKKATSRRTRIETNSGPRFVRRNEDGEFKTEVSVGRSLAADRRRKAKTKVKSGQGDRGDE